MSKVNIWDLTWRNKKISERHIRCQRDHSQYLGFDLNKIRLKFFRSERARVWIFSMKINTRKIVSFLCIKETPTLFMFNHYNFSFYMENFIPNYFWLKSCPPPPIWKENPCLLLSENLIQEVSEIDWCERFQIQFLFY